MGLVEYEFIWYANTAISAQEDGGWPKEEIEQRPQSHITAIKHTPTILKHTVSYHSTYAHTSEFQLLSTTRLRIQAQDSGTQQWHCIQTHSHGTGFRLTAMAQYSSRQA
jgi:hypothetical protein